jgi:uncharacterized membrane protein
MAEPRDNSRLEAFCDGVFAIALTLLIIDIRIPASLSEKIKTTRDLWLALEKITPSIFAFILSFAIIIITWVNHHNTLKLVNKSSAPFFYANGLFLLSVVFIPFPTSLLGEYLLTDHSSPAVILYSSVCAFQAIGWNLLTFAAIKPKLLTKNEKSTRAMLRHHRYSYFAFGLYTVCALAAIWYPQTIAIAISVIWIIWLIIGINVNGE